MSVPSPLSTATSAATHPAPWRLNPRPLLVALVVILFFLTLANLFSIYLVFELKRDFAFGIVPLFYFDREANLPAAFAGSLLAFTGILALAIASWRRQEKSRDALPWRIIGFTLLFLALDEVASIHDQLDFIISPRVETTGALAWPWVIPYALLTLAFVSICFPLYWRLPRRYQILLGLAACLYVGAAIGLEMVGATLAAADQPNVAYALVMTVEEFCEKTAAILAIYTLLDYLRKECPGFALQFSVKPPLSRDLPAA